MDKFSAGHITLGLFKPNKMPRKQHLYIFLNKNEFEEYEISTRIVLKYMNQFVIDEEAQIEIIEIRAIDLSWVNSDSFVGQFPERYSSQIVRLYRPLIKAIEMAWYLSDDETDNHFIFGRYTDFLTEYLKRMTSIQEKILHKFLPPVTRMLWSKKTKRLFYWRDSSKRF